MGSDDVDIADIAEYKDQLFELYARLRYNELICDELMAKAGRVETLVKWSVLGCVAISLVTGSTASANPAVLTPVWAVFNALATLLAIYSLVVASGAKRSEWFGLATRFHGLSDEVELFSEYVKRRKIGVDELLARWEIFSRRLSELLDRGGVEHRDYAQAHAEQLAQRIGAILKREGKSV